MKKIISGILAVIMLTALFATNAFAATETNLCRYFDSTVGYAVSGFFGTAIDTGEKRTYENIPVGYFLVTYIQYSLQQDGLLEQYAFSEENENNLPPTIKYKVPFAVFEEKAKSIANYSGDLKTVDEYDSESNSFVLTRQDLGIDQGHPAFVIGYNDNGNNSYTVYIQRMQYGYKTIKEVEAEFGNYYSDYDRDKDIFQDYDGLYHLVHRNIFYKADITYSNGKVFFESVNEMNNIDGITMITRDTVVSADTSVKADKDGCSVSADNGVFPAGTEVSITKLTDGGNFTIANNAMADIADKFTAFEISATNNNTAVQPNGKVTVTFAIPDGYDADNLAVYYVANDGTTQKLDGVIDKTAKTITVELTHFSTYVVAQTKATVTTDQGTDTTSKDNNKSPQTGDNSNMVLWISLLFISGGVLTTLGITKKCRKNSAK